MLNYFDHSLLENSRIVRGKPGSESFELRQANGHDMTLVYKRGLSDWRPNITVHAVFTDEFGEQRVLLHSSDIQGKPSENEGVKFWQAAQQAEFDSTEDIRGKNRLAVNRMLDTRKPKRKTK
jgi:hypothetical protein